MTQADRLRQLVDLLTEARAVIAYDLPNRCEKPDCDHCLRAADSMAAIDEALLAEAEAPADAVTRAKLEMLDGQLEEAANALRYAYRPSDLARARAATKNARVELSELRAHLKGSPDAE
jgi:hypothetical protein